MKQQKYPYELKKQVVELYFEGESAPEITSKFNLSNRRRVYDWVNIVKEHGYTALENGIPKVKHEVDVKDAGLKEENTRLKLENEYLKKLLDLQRG